jgi:hypothetical protein
MAFIRFNPEPYLKKITCPVLALNGEWDFQVDATQTFNALKENVKNLTCKLLPKQPWENPSKSGWKAVLPTHGSSYDVPDWRQLV